MNNDNTPPRDESSTRFHSMVDEVTSGIQEFGFKLGGQTLFWHLLQNDEISATTILSTMTDDQLFKLRFVAIALMELLADHQPGVNDHVQPPERT
jgi:hypothetical protein